MGHKLPAVQTQAGGVVLHCGRRELHQFLVSVRYCRHKTQPNKKTTLGEGVIKMHGYCGSVVLVTTLQPCTCPFQPRYRTGEGGGLTSDGPRPLMA